MASSLRRTDLLSLSNFRNDGRRPHELRQFKIQLGPLGDSSNAAGGSALVEMGLTVVLATVRGPLDCLRRSDELVDRAVVDVTVKFAPFASSAERRYRNPNSDRRLMEASHRIQSVMETTILTHLYPKCRIEITTVVLADDGSVLCAAINAVTLALQDAGIPMKDFCCACSAGYIATMANNHAANDTVDYHDDYDEDDDDNDDWWEGCMVDLNRREESTSSSSTTVQVPCAMLPQRGTVVLAHCEARLPNFTALEHVLEAAMEGCRAVFQVMQAAVREKAAGMTTLPSSSSSISTAQLREMLESIP